MRPRKQLRAGKRRRVTDVQIRVLQAWMPFKELARALGISQKYAVKIRMGMVHHKNPSP
jgi:hypothetical protein